MPQITVPPLPGAGPLALDEIQGIVLRGYSYFHIRYFILKIGDGEEALAGARALCEALRPESKKPLTITTAKPWPKASPPPYCLNIGVTNTGLRKLIGADNYKAVRRASSSLFTSVNGTSFDAGASDSRTAFVVGDVGESAPSEWWPEENRKLPGQPTPDDLHVLLCLYTRSPEDRDFWSERLREMIPLCSDGQQALVPAFVQDADPLPPPEIDYKGAITIHFDYADGFSQPRIAGAPAGEAEAGDDDSPIVPSYYFAIAADPGPYRAHQLLVNGSFGAFRLLYQDVAAFRNFLSKSPTPDLLAAKMCGRWYDGTPLEVSPDGPDPALKNLDFTNFNYLQATANQRGPRGTDPLGAICPYAAHTRRTNPRDDTAVRGNFNGDGSPAFAVQNRVRRFATPYGPAYTPETAGEQRGLVGLFMGANLANQFEFLMQQWMEGGHFRNPDASPNGSGIDPLFGAHDGETNADKLTFAYPSGSEYEQFSPMSRFIVTKGGLYVFLPSVAALGCLARGSLPPPA